MLKISNNHHMKKFFVLAFVAFMACASMVAQDVPGTKEEVAVPQSATMLEVAGQLVKYGYAEKEALPLIQAAEIYQTLSGNALAEQPERGEAAATEGEEKGENNVSFDVAQLLTDATEYANGDETLLALINNIKNSATRGPVNSYNVTTERVAARSEDTYKIRFRGGEVACVIVSGDGDTDLDLFIYNSNGNLVTSDTDNTDDCVCTWTPSYTQTYTIKVKNYGRVYNQYRIAVL